MRYFDGYDAHGEEKGLFANPGPKADLQIVDADRPTAPQTYGLSQKIVDELAQAYAEEDAIGIAIERGELPCPPR